MRDFAAAEWVRAGRALASARQLAASDPDSAASRVYYAAFHALTALFAIEGRSFSKHSAIRAALHRELVQTGRLPAPNARDYDFLLDLRETGDYGGLTQVTPESARMAITKGEQFLEAIARIAPDLPRLAGAP
jgi:uncharacterized protein (UPF0332 family)